MIDKSDLTLFNHHNQNHHHNNHNHHQLNIHIKQDELLEEQEEDDDEETTRCDDEIRLDLENEKKLKLVKNQNKFEVPSTSTKIKVKLNDADLEHNVDDDDRDDDDDDDDENNNQIESKLNIKKKYNQQCKCNTTTHLNNKRIIMPNQQYLLLPNQKKEPNQRHCQSAAATLTTQIPNKLFIKNHVTSVSSSCSSTSSSSSSSSSSTSSSSFIRSLSNKIRYRRRTISLNDLNTKKLQKKNLLNATATTTTTTTTTTTNTTNNKLLKQNSRNNDDFNRKCLNDCSHCSRYSIIESLNCDENLLCNKEPINVDDSLSLFDQIVPAEQHSQHQHQPQIKQNGSTTNKTQSTTRKVMSLVKNKLKSATNSSNETLQCSSNFNNEFDNFSNLNFYKQCNDHCGPMQNHLFSLKIVQPHSDCVPNCCDMISYLPKMISYQIFSYLDPKSLARASQVNKLWYELANDRLLWKKFCHLPKWRFSMSSESKQLIKYTDQNNQIDWKEIFAERYRVKRNWLNGKSHIRTFYGHEEAVSCVQFDDTRIVAGSAAGTIKVWNISESSSSSSTMAQSAQMPYLSLFGHSGTIRCLHLDGELNRLFSGSADHTIKVWDLSEVHPTWSRVACKMTFLGHTDTVRCLQVNGTILISGSYDDTLKIWDLKTGQCKNTLRGHTDSVLCLQFDHEKIISGSADKTIRIWNFEGTCLAKLEGHTGSVTCLHFDSQRIISGSLDFDIKFWRIDNGLCINTLNWITKEGHTAAIRCLKADSHKIVSCSDDKTIKIWNIETGERLVTLKNHSDGVTCLQFNDYFILSGSYDRTIKLWDFSVH